MKPVKRMQVLCGAVLIAFNASAAAQTQQFYYIKNNLYIEECGACHLAYPPQLLPGAAWSTLMQRLDSHFGENAELDDELRTHIEQYLRSHALGISPPSRMSQMMRETPADPPLRITEFPAFVETHAVIKTQLEMDAFPTGFLSPCGDCHRQAAAAIFDKELLHPGYGPSVWGGPNSDSGP